jgi:hypothetical protein
MLAGLGPACPGPVMDEGKPTKAPAGAGATRQLSYGAAAASAELATPTGLCSGKWQAAR